MLQEAWFDTVIWSTFTLLAYCFGLLLYRWSSGQPLCHPIITAALLTGVAMWICSVGVDDYQEYTSLLAELLGPATVALAIPLHNQFRVIAQLGWRMLLPIIAGGVLAPALAWLSIWGLMDNAALEMTVLSKSITTPLAIEVSRTIGGIPHLAAVIVITTGIVGAMVAPVVYTVLNVQQDEVKGISLGTVAHAIGTASAVKISDMAAALASTALCLNGVFMALLLPILFA